MDDHLTDETLNEYLDLALTVSQQAQVATHLSRCPACAGRLEALQVAFARLEALPAAELEHSLVPGVMQSLPGTLRPKPDAATVRPRPGALRWVSLGQLLAAAVLAALAWPFVAAQAARLGEQWPLVRWTLADAATQAQAALSALRAAIRAADPGWSEVQRWLGEGINGLGQTWPLGAALALPPVETVVAFLAAALAWLVGNALLLRRPLQHRIRRRS